MVNVFQHIADRNTTYNMSSTCTWEGVYDAQMSNMRLIGTSTDPLMFTKFYRVLQYAAPQFCSKHSEDITNLLAERKEQTFADPSIPTLSTTASEIEVYVIRQEWKAEFDEVKIQKAAYVTNKSAIRDVILGQCDEDMMSKLEEDSDWMAKKMDLLYVLDTVQAACSHVQSNHHPLVSARAALKELINCHQNSSKMQEFKEKMVARVKTMELAGVSIKFGKRVTD